MVLSLHARADTVTITPQGGFDAYDDPLPAGEPFDVKALVAPTGTGLQQGADAELDEADFTLYLPLRIKRGGVWVSTAEALTDDFTVAVRGRVCVGRVKVWNLGGAGGVEVVATSAKGAS